MTERISVWQRVKNFAQWARSQEPARVQAIWRAVVGVFAAVGVTVGTDVDGRVTAGITALYVLLTVTQGEQTRARVVPADNVPPAFYSDDSRPLPPV